MSQSACQEPPSASITPEIPTPTEAADPRRWLMLSVVLTAPLMAIFDQFVVNVAIPTMQRDLHASFGAIQFVIAGTRGGNVGSASGVLTTVRQIAGAIGVAVLGILFFGLLAAGADGVATQAVPTVQAHLGGQSLFGCPQQRGFSRARPSPAERR